MRGGYHAAVRRMLLPAVVLAVASATLWPADAREIVAFESHPAGTIVIKTGERRLYLVLGGGRALRYRVAVGRPDKQWTGVTHVGGRYLHPDWTPPPEVKRDIPSLPDFIPGGAPNNPMGAAALTLGNGEYAIHGTNRPESVGRFASYGCFRMYNADVLDLYARVRVGTPVIVRE